MYPRFATALLFSFFAFGLTTAFVVPDCGPNAEFLRCGSACVPNCAHPEPPKACTLQCVMGCFCKPGFLKNANGECVRAEQCEAQTQVLMQENIALPPECPANEEFKLCGSACAPTCSNPHPSPVCTRQCVIGCFCKPGFLRNKYHVCVPTENCDAPAPHNNMLFAYPPGHTLKPAEPEVCAGVNEEWHQCRLCDGTCDKPHRLCPTTICKPGCSCKKDHVRDATGKCIPQHQCSKTNMLFAYPPDYTPMPVEPQVCVGKNEEWRQCKGCDGTCDNPHPPCPRICVSGCACKLNHVRGANGECIPKEQCPKMDLVQLMMMPPVCKQNEVFKTCGTACPATCANPHPSAVCTKNCVIGCFCKEGFLKHANGECVPTNNCEMPVETATKPYGDDILCPTDREVYIDDDLAAEYNCIASCDTPLPYMIRGRVQVPKKCKEVKPGPGCICRFPYYRNEEGKCVERQECHKTTPFMTTTPSQ